MVSCGGGGQQKKKGNAEQTSASNLFALALGSHPRERSADRTHKFIMEAEKERLHDDWYTSATWGATAFLALLLLAQSRCRCDWARACSALEYVYLPVYLLAIMADWLQGPYVYALYSAMGFGRTDINVLFVMGFGTSGLLGPFIGQMADRFGRKQMILVMCALCPSAQPRPAPRLGRRPPALAGTAARTPSPA